ncbi:methyl-accepting chemotaxis protein [Modicisalibacter xianhensis]|nr:methyl-accepting chemotaxis protein [Halomonas xianhensis]
MHWKPAQRISLRARLMSGFLIIIALMILLTAIGIVKVNDIDDSLTIINDVNSVKQRHAIDFRGSVHDRAIALRDVTLVRDDTKLEALLADIDRLAANYRSAATAMQTIFRDREDITDQERRALEDIENIESRTLPLIEEVSARRQAGDFEAAQGVLLTEAAPAFTEWLNDINAFIDLQERMNEAETATARNVAGSFEIFMITLCGTAVIIGLAVATLLTRWLRRELGAEPHEVKAFAEAIGSGKLTQRARLRNGDGHSIMASLSAMARQLQTTVWQVRTSAETVAGNSEQIAEGNNELASRTEQQASALTETASSMEELGSTVTQNADNARQANTEAANASHIAVKGGEAVNQVVDTMQELNKRSAEIAEIISMIDEIAFQTNILALNASVEAARAGEHGRGFAVVASEVRQLAQRSADAAGQINTLITGNLKRVEQGTLLATDAGRTMEEVVAAIQRVTDIMAEISTASVEQSEGVQQIGVAVLQMDQVTQRNAALVEENATAANNLRLGAQQLLKAMAAFQLDLTEPTGHEPNIQADQPGSTRGHATRTSTPLLEWRTA